MLKATGERQIGKTLDQIKPDHRERYLFAANWLQEHIEGALVLDGACGTGYGSYIIAESGKSTVIGVDISDDAIAHGNQHFKHHNVTLSNLDLVSGEWPFDDAMFDLCVSFETIEHVENPETYLNKVSKSAEWLICSVPNEEVMPYNGYHFPFHVRHYNPKQFQELIESCGFVVKEMYTQEDKHVGHVVKGNHGRNLVIVAKSKHA